MEDPKQLCRQLLASCQNTIPLNTRKSNTNKNELICKLKQKIDENKMMSKMSPEQLQQNNKIIEKMKKKGLRRQKETFIKKTTLGEDQLTFTKQQYAQLQMIDEFKRKGFTYIKLDQLTQSNNNQSQKTAVQRLKQLAKVQYTTEEIIKNLEWGNLKDVKSSLNRKGSKGQFVKHFNSNSYQNLKFPFLRQANIDDVENTKHSLNKYYKTLLNKKSFRNSFLASYNLKRPAKKETHLTFQAKIQMIRQRSQSYIKKKCNDSIYMTEERRNALFQCQVYRLARKMLNQSQYQQLTLLSSSMSNQNHQQIVQIPNSKERKSDDQQNKYPAEAALAKNYQRIKAQRKRVIQKMLC